MHNNPDNSLFQEIEEDLQRQRYEALWKKHGMTIVSIALAIVLATSAVVGWKSYNQNRSESRTAGLAKVLLDHAEKKDESFIKDLKAIEQEQGPTAQSAMARLYAADEAVKEGKTQDALDIYNALAQDKGVPAVYNDMGQILYVMTAMDKGDAKDLEDRLVPVMASTSIWRFMASELVGHLAYKTGQMEKAKKIFVDLVNSDETPPGISRRASDMLLLVAGGK